MKRFIISLFAAVMMMCSCSVCAFADDGQSEGGSAGTIVICVVVGALGTGFIGGAVLKGQLKSVSFQRAARQYIKPGSFNLTSQRDIYLYKKIERREKPKQTQQQ